MENWPKCNGKFQNQLISRGHLKLARSAKMERRGANWVQLKSFERSSSCKSELWSSQILLHRCHLYQHHHHQHHHHLEPSFLLLPPLSSSASTSNLSDLSNSSRAPRLGPCASFVKLYRQPPHFIITRTSSGGLASRKPLHRKKEKTNRS